MTNGEFLRRLWAEAKAYWSVLLAGVVAMAVTAITEPTLAWGLKWLIDEGFKASAKFNLWLVPLVLIGLFVIRGISTFSSNYCMHWMSNRIAANLRGKMFAKALQLPSQVLSNDSSAKYVSLMTMEVANVTHSIGAIIPALVRDSLVVVSLLAWLFWLNWKLTMITLVMIPVAGWLIWASLGRIREISKQNISLVADMSGVVEEAMSNQRVVKIYNGQTQEKERFGTAAEKLRNFQRRLVVAQGMQAPLTQIIAAIALSAVVVMALNQARADQTTIGGFVSFVTAMLMLLTPLKHLADVSGQLQRAAASAEVVYKLIDEPGEADEGKQIIERAKGDIQLHNVSFAYPGAEKAALKSLSFTVPSGKTIALVGPSGGGKSSVASLLPRFYQPSQGHITLDGVPIHELSLESLRGNIAMVSQEVMLFNASIAENIAYGAKRYASQAEIRAAASAAYLDEFVQSLPQGYQTVIGERGAKLSGGQRQRLAIARALLKDAPILILDEATSALDADSERYVQQALEGLMKNRTTIVIAHRLSTVQHADEILVLSQGAILERGTHETLLKAKGIYAGLYQSNPMETTQ